MASTTSAASTTSSGTYGTDTSRVRSVEQIMDELSKARSDKFKSRMSKLFSGDSDKKMSNFLDSNDISDVAGKSDESKSKNSDGKGVVGNAVDAVTGVVKSNMNPRSYLKTAIASFVGGAAGGAGASTVTGLFTGAQQPATQATAEKTTASVGISAAEYAQQTEMIAKNQESGRDTKYLKITENQWNNMTELQRATVVGTIFMNVDIPEMDEFKDHMQKMTYGELTGIMAPDATGPSKELVSLTDEQMATIDEIVEGDNVVDIDGNAVNRESDVESPSMDADIKDEPVTDTPDAGAYTPTDEEIIAAQSALVADGAPDFDENEDEADYSYSMK